MLKHSLSVALLAVAALATQAQADTVTIAPDNTWHAFDVDSLSASSGGLEWISLSNGSALSFSLTLAAPAYLTVVDGGFSGDRFQVFDNSTLLGETSAAVNSYPTSVVTNFDAALANPNYSRGTYFLDAGVHNITGLLSLSALDDTNTPIDATVGAVRVAPVPLPAAGLLFLFGSSVLGFFTRRRIA
jgi:hypothetical protein